MFKQHPNLMILDRFSATDRRLIDAQGSLQKPRNKLSSWGFERVDVTLGLKRTLGNSQD